MKRKNTARNLVLSALFAALTAVLSQIQVPLGPVPFNLGVFGAYMAGMLLMPGAAITSMAVYMLMGAVGLPVFVGFIGGPGVLLGKTGGYLLGYFAIAGMTSLAMAKNMRLLHTAAMMAAGLILCYAFGTAWFMVITGADLASSLMWCVVPFVLPDICKGAGAYVLGKTVRKRMRAAALRL